MYENLELISILSNILSIILAIMGLYLVYKNWVVWKRTSLNIIKARAFLNKEFLERNWFYVVAAGGLIALRRVYRCIELSRDSTINEPNGSIIRHPGVCCNSPAGLYGIPVV